MRGPIFRLFAALAAIFVFCSLAVASGEPQILPLSQIQPGMKGVGYTIFSGNNVQPFDVEVIGVLPNLIGPKQDVVLVRLSSPEIAKSGVVDGMSGSPVYINGKLAGAIAYKFGSFTSEALAGMTPIEEELAVSDLAKPGASRKTRVANAAAEGSHYEMPDSLTREVGLGRGVFLEPIAAPLAFSGFLPSVIGRYSGELEKYGMMATEGGSVPASPSDANLQPGEMAAIVLVSGDSSVTAGCTVTARIGDQVYLCGHSLFGFGKVNLAMARAHVVATLPSAMNSTKIMNAGGLIGSIGEDLLTGVMGSIGPAAAMIPVELAVETPDMTKRFHFEVAENSKLTPLLVSMVTLNGVQGNLAYNDTNTFQLDGSIDIAGHSPVHLENMFAPNDQQISGAAPIAAQVQATFGEIFHNPFEQPHITAIRLAVHSVPNARWAAIDSAWSDRKEAHPGETIAIKVALRPYRGAPILREVPLVIPSQTEPGTLHILVSDAATLDRVEQYFPLGPSTRVTGLQQLIDLLNQERQNDRLYVTLLQPAPTLLVEDKRLPDVPLSEINVLSQRNPGRTTVLWQSELAEQSVPLHEVITGHEYLTITVK